MDIMNGCGGGGDWNGWIMKGLKRHVKEFRFWGWELAMGTY